MRVSILRLWISVGFAVLGVQVALMIFVLVRTRTELKEMRETSEALKKENERLKKEMSSVHLEVARLRTRAPVEKTETTRPEPEIVAGTSIDAADLVRHYREAVIRDETGRAEALARKLIEVEARAVPEVIKAIGMETGSTVKAALYALLGMFTSRDGLAYLQRGLLDERERTVRMEIAAALAKIGDSTSMTVLTSALRDEKDGSTRMALMKAVAKIDVEEGAQILGDLYDVAADSDKVQILTILSTMTLPQLKTRYERILDSSKSVTDRVLAVRGLGNLPRDPATLVRLEALKTSDPEETVRIEAERAIFKLNPQ